MSEERKFVSKPLSVPKVSGKVSRSRQVLQNKVKPLQSVSPGSPLLRQPACHKTSLAETCLSFSEATYAGEWGIPDPTGAFPSGLTEGTGQPLSGDPQSLGSKLDDVLSKQDNFILKHDRVLWKQDRVLSKLDKFMERLDTR